MLHVSRIEEVIAGEFRGFCKAEERITFG